MTIQIKKRTMDDTNFSWTPTWDVYDGDQSLGRIEKDHGSFEAHVPGRYGFKSVHYSLVQAVDYLIQENK